MSDDKKPRPVRAWAIVWSDGEISPTAYRTEPEGWTIIRAIDAQKCTVKPVIIMLESDYNDLTGGGDGSR